MIQDQLLVLLLLLELHCLVEFGRNPDGIKLQTVILRSLVINGEEEGMCEDRLDNLSLAISQNMNGGSQDHTFQPQESTKLDGFDLVLGE